MKKNLIFEAWGAGLDMNALTKVLGSYRESVNRGYPYLIFNKGAEPDKDAPEILNVLELVDIERFAIGECERLVRKISIYMENGWELEKADSVELSTYGEERVLLFKNRCDVQE